MTPATALRHHYRLVLAITGRIRFLSHLETVDTLLGCVRRTGVSIAQSEGFRPKPRIKVAMPRPVAVEAWSDIVEIELQEHIEPDAFARRLAEALPAGLELRALDRLEGHYESAASRVTGATYRWSFAAERGLDRAALERAVERLVASDEAYVDRRPPKKPARRVDVRRFVEQVALVHDEPLAVRAHVRLTPDGSAKPEEVVRVLAAQLESELTVLRTVRESITCAEPGEGDHTLSTTRELAEAHGIVRQGQEGARRRQAG